MNQQDKKNYHLTCILNPDLDEEKRVKIVKQIKDKIQKLEGTIEKESAQPEELKKSRLSYLMNKTREAYYWEADINLPAKETHQLQSELNLNKNLIRFLITANKPEKTNTQKETISEKDLDLNIIDKIEPITEQSIEPEVKTEAETEKSQEPSQSEPKKKKDPKAKIENIDKKLDEILNE